MKNNDCKKIYENMEKMAIKLSESISKVVKEIDIVISSEVFKQLIDFIQNIPDDIKKTQFFEKVQQLQKKNLCYEDVTWLIDDFGITYNTDEWKKQLDKAEQQSDLYRYICHIILCNNIQKREKLVVLLAHVESLIYDALNISKGENSKLKKDIRKISIEENQGMSTQSLGKVYLLAVTYIVFANTDSYTEDIDKRMPFRNNILHNGIVLYSDDDIESAYQLLIELISMVMQVKTRCE